MQGSKLALRDLRADLMIASLHVQQKQRSHLVQKKHLKAHRRVGIKMVQTKEGEFNVKSEEDQDQGPVLGTNLDVLAQGPRRIESDWPASASVG